MLVTLLIVLEPLRMVMLNITVPFRKVLFTLKLEKGLKPNVKLAVVIEPLTVKNSKFSAEASRTELKKNNKQSKKNVDVNRFVFLC